MAAVGVLLVILLLLLTVPFLAAADAFCDNLKSVAATLPKNTSSSPEHFATSTFGQTPDTVYALALCLADVLDDSTCANCIANTFEVLLKLTPSPQQQCYMAASYYSSCILIYSVNNILSAPPNTTRIGDDGTQTFERWKTEKDDRLIDGALIQKLLGVTVKEAAASTKPKRFCTVELDNTGTTFPNVYSLAQCTPDLSAGDCLACLSHLLDMVNFTMPLRMGGQMGATRCYFRYEASHFYNGDPMIHFGQPSAPATTKQKSKSGPMVLVAATVIIYTFSRHAYTYTYIAISGLIGNLHLQ